MPYEEIALALLDRGANPNDASDTVSVLALACLGGRHTLVKKMLEKGAAPNVGYFRDTPLMFMPDAESARLLIAHGAEVNAIDSRGGTALLSAVASGDIELIEVLLQHGAQVSVKDKKGFTPMTMQVDGSNSHHAKILALLRQYGAK